MIIQSQNKSMALIRIKNLALQTFIGFNPEVKVNKQEVIINLEMEVDVPAHALETDDPEGIYDYKKITKQVISLVEEGRFHLLEVLTHKILVLVMENQKVKKAIVQVDKPGALRFAESVSAEMEARR